MKKNKLTKYYIYLFVISIACFSLSYAENMYNNADIIINWQKGHIISKNTASIEYKDGIPVDSLGNTISINRARTAAYEEAKERAIQSIAEAIKNLRVDSRNNMLDILNTSRKTQIILSDKLVNAVQLKYYPSDYDSSVCEAKIHFRDIIESIQYDFPSDDFPRRAEIPISTPYTSLIVDCRDLNIEPMLFPSVLSDDGLEIYGKNFIESSYALKGGMVSYCSTEEQSMLDSRAGKHPYYASAIKSINSCPVLAEKDVRRILSSNDTIINLKKCRVIFIINNRSR